MKAAVIVFPGSNCDRDMAVALESAGVQVEMVWHKQDVLPEGTDLVAIPGGFSYGDYLRCGAIAAQSPISNAVKVHADRGGYVLGVCNGFQVLTEMQILPGALLRNGNLKYICKPVELRVESDASIFTENYGQGDVITVPIAHHDGNYTADPETVAMLNGDGRVAFRYVDNPNGSTDEIAGVLSANKRVLGMMPHPERFAEEVQGGTDGAAMFRSLTKALTIS